MRVKDIMTHVVETTTPDETVVLANEKMWRRRIHHLVVMDGETLVGVLSDTDLGGPQADTIPDNLKVGQIMSRNVVTIDENETLDKARNLMRGHQFHCLPIQSNGKVIGIITSSDLFKLETRGVDEVIYHGKEPHRGPYIPQEAREKRGKSKTHHTEWPTRQSP